MSKATVQEFFSDPYLLIILNLAITLVFSFLKHSPLHFHNFLDFSVTFTDIGDCYLRTTSGAPLPPQLSVSLLEGLSRAEILISQLCLVNNYGLIKPILIISLPIDND